MKKNGKNEELQSRREFFKRAAKGALPINKVKSKCCGIKDYEWCKS